MFYLVTRFITPEKNHNAKECNMQQTAHEDIDGSGMYGHRPQG